MICQVPSSYLCRCRVGFRSWDRKAPFRTEEMPRFRRTAGTDAYLGRSAVTLSWVRAEAAPALTLTPISSMVSPSGLYCSNQCRASSRIVSSRTPCDYRLRSPFPANAPLRLSFEISASGLLLGTGEFHASGLLPFARRGPAKLTRHTPAMIRGTSQRAGHGSPSSGR
jgi:hypothetical protein